MAILPDPDERQVDGRGQQGPADAADDLGWIFFSIEQEGMDDPVL